MSRPTSLDLTAAEQPWRSVPMPGSNGTIDLVPLASADGAFTILGRFAPGFERLSPGGFLCSEEFLVLDGEVELEGTTYGRGDLTVVPAHLVRTSMRSARGCLLLAWFGGPAVFREPQELGAVEGAIESAPVRADDLPASPVGAWSTRPPALGETADVVDLGLRSWRRHSGDRPTETTTGSLVRRDLTPRP